MTALSFSVSATASAPVAALASSAPARVVVPPEAQARATSQVSPTSSRSVTTETFAAIQKMGINADVADAAAQEEQAQAAEPKSIQERQAEARRWERYYAHQPRRLADLLAVYYGGQQTSLDARGPAPKPLEEYIRGEPSE